MITLENILKLNGSRNAGGLSRVELIFERDIISFPNYNPSNQHFTGEMELKEGARPYFIYFTPKSGIFTEDTNTSNAAGDFNTQSLTIRTPKNRPLTREFRRRLLNNRVAVVYIDRNGEFRLIRQLRCRPLATTGNKGGYNGTTFRFTGQSIQPSGFWAYTPNPYIAPPDIEPDQPDIVDTGGGDSGGGTDPSDPTLTSCAETYTHCQDTLAQKWIIPHNKNMQINQPTLRTHSGYDLFSEDLVERVFYSADNNTVEIDFKMPVSGCAFITGFKACDCQAEQTYTHCQDTFSNVWTISHNLGDDINRPTLRTHSGYDLYAENLVQKILFLPDNNTVEIHFKQPVSGCAFITAYGGDSCDC